MPKAKAKKSTQFNTSPVKSISYYGQPNVWKSERLSFIQSEYVKLVNHYIGFLHGNTEYMLFLVKNDSRSAEMRTLEKSLRPRGVNSAFSQNAFDEAVKHLSAHYNDIRLEMLKEDRSVFVRSKVFFAMSLAHKSRQEMCTAMAAVAKKTGNDFHKDAFAKVYGMKDADFRFAMESFHDLFSMLELVFQCPAVKHASVPLDSRLHKLERSFCTTFSHVVTITDPFRRSSRIAVPVRTSRDAMRRLIQHKAAGSVSFAVREDGSLRIMHAFTKKAYKPDTEHLRGADVGIRDCIHDSEGNVFGSFDGIIAYYKTVVEPSLAGCSDLRNKKKKISHFLRTHKNLPEDVRRSLILKIDRLEEMLRKEQASTHKRNRYYHDLDRIVAETVNLYLESIDRNTLTILERLDIKEFEKSRKSNGMLSMFARGLLQKRLMEQLNWHGFDFLEVEPDYTSQACPVCGNIDSANRNGKQFRCTCCGHEDDADHVGAVNIKGRASDNEVLAVCETYKYNHKEMQEAIKDIFKVRNIEWRKKNRKAEAA